MGRVVLAVVVAACAASLARAATPTYPIVGDVRIGSFRVQSDGTLGGAIRAFGRPTTIKATSDNTCTATWRPIKLTLFTYNLGGQDACSARYGHFGRATMRGPAWRTTKGLRVGDPVARVRRLYPRAELHRGKRFFWPTGFWLVERVDRFGTGGTSPGLIAEIRGGRVTGFHVRYQAGGD